MLSPEGLLNGLTALGVLVVNGIIGIYAIYKSRKLQARLLTFAGLSILLIGLLWLGPTTDFLKILTTGTNLEPRWIYPILSYMWIAPGLLFLMYIGAELLTLERRWYILLIFMILGIIFEIFLILHPFISAIPDPFTYTMPDPLGSNIIDTSFEYGSLTFILMVIFIISVLIFNGIGFLRKAFQSTGLMKKKFLYLSLGFILFPASAAFDSILPPGPLLPVIRTCVIISGILWYLGLKS